MPKDKLVLIKSPSSVPSGPSTGTWRDSLRRSSGRVLPTLGNLNIFMEYHDHLAARWRKNLLTGFIMDWHTNEAMTDAKVYEWIIWFDQQEQLSFNKETMWAGIITAANVWAFHPIRQYLESLVWDGKARIEKFSSTYLGSEDSEAPNFAGRLLLNQAVRRIFEPGCKADYMPILVGEQGIGKSTALAILGGEGYGEVYVPLDDNYYLQIAHTHWISEVSELAPFKKALDSRIKQVLSTQHDDIHFPYARAIERLNRRFVFVGTTNEYDFSTDATGARRMVPLHCDKVDLKGLQADRDQIWAEALHRYRSLGEVLFVLPESLKTLQKALYVTTPLEEELRGKLASVKWPDIVTNKDITKFLGLTHQESLSLGKGREIRDAMTHLKYGPLRTRDHRGYKKLLGWEEPK